MPDPANPILLYDGVCGLCNRLVQFVLKHDTQASWRFASLQSSYAAEVLKPRGFNPQDLNTLYAVDGHNLLTRSDAVVFLLHTLGGIWRALAMALHLLPKPLRDWGYQIVARRRYRIFGRYENCPLPEEKYKGRFLDV